MKEKIMDEIKEAVKKEMGEAYEISFKAVPKNNGPKTAIIIKGADDRVFPCICIDGILRGLNNKSMDIQGAAREIIDIYRHADMGKWEAYRLAERMGKEHILGNVVYQLINTEYNRGLLGETPHRGLLDLSAVYRTVLSRGGCEDRSILVTYSLCREYGIGEDELDAAARQNTKRKGFSVWKTSEVISEITGAPHGGIKGSYPEMFILTNESHNNGAAVMLYGEYFENLAKEMGDLYVMPSSIHEVIAIPAKGVDPDALRRIVADVNEREVSDEEVLGQNIYRYSTGKGLRIV